jgi:hypothetical protein
MATGPARHVATAAAAQAPQEELAGCTEQAFGVLHQMRGAAAWRRHAARPSFIYNLVEGIRPARFDGRSSGYWH